MLRKRERQSHLPSIGSSFADPAVLCADLKPVLDILNDVRQVKERWGYNDINVAWDLCRIKVLDQFLDTLLCAIRLPVPTYKEFP